MSETKTQRDTDAPLSAKRSRVDASQIMSQTLAFAETKVLERAKERGLRLVTLPDNVWSSILPFLAMSDVVKVMILVVSEITIRVVFQTGYFRVPKQYVLPDTASHVISIDNTFLTKFMGTADDALVSVEYWDRSKIGSNARVLNADTHKLKDVPLGLLDQMLWVSHFKKLRELRLFVHESTTILEALVNQNPDLTAVSLIYLSLTEELADDLITILDQVAWTEFSLERKMAGRRLPIDYLDHLPTTLTKLRITMPVSTDVPTALPALLQRCTRLVDLDLQTRSPDVRIEVGLFAKSRQKWQRLKYDNLLNDADLRAFAGDSLRVLICDKQRDEGQRIHADAVRSLIRNSPNLQVLELSLYAEKVTIPAPCVIDLCVSQRDGYNDVFEELMEAKCASVIERFALGRAIFWDFKLQTRQSPNIIYVPRENASKFTLKYFRERCPRLDFAKLVT